MVLGTLFHSLFTGCCNKMPETVKCKIVKCRTLFFSQLWQGDANCDPRAATLSVCLSVSVSWDTLALLHVASHSLLGQLGQGCPSGARILKESTYM